MRFNIRTPLESMRHSGGRGGALVGDPLSEAARPLTPYGATTERFSNPAVIEGVLIIVPRAVDTLRDSYLAIVTPHDPDCSMLDIGITRRQL